MKKKILNTQIEDLQGEEWIDVIGYDGSYEVSNFGRIKSVYRLVSGRWSDLVVKPRIMSQHECNRSLKVQLCLSGECKQFCVSNLVYLSFNKDSPLRPNECIMHIDKNIYNNNIDNLKIETRKLSRKQDFIKKAHSIEKCNKNLEKANDRNRLFYSTRTHKTCNVCEKSKEIAKFIQGHNKCKECYNFEMREKRRLIKINNMKK